jgi:ribosomal protein S18 acetylase RimI-like enzyme
MSSCCHEVTGETLQVAVLAPGDARAFGELLALPGIADHYFSCPREQLGPRIAAIASWSGWQTDGILYLAARDASGGFVAGAHLTATSIGFFVHPAWRGHGWGSRLVGACADQAAAHGLHALHAATRPDNLPAQALLSRTGFSRVGTAGLARWDYRRDL